LITRFFYGCAIRLYSLVVRVASLFVPKARQWVEGRRNWRASLQERMSKKATDQKVAWFHSASLGEFEQGRPVIEAFRRDHPEYFLLLTFYSPSGYEVRKGYQGVDHICYLPSDTRRNARDFVETVNPTIALFIKYEFWYNHLSELKERRIPTVLFAAIFRPEQVFFKSWGGFYRSMLGMFDAILVQNTESKQLLGTIPGTNEVVVAGDPRFDRVTALAANARELPEIDNFVGEHYCIVVGSAWEQDMNLIIPVLNRMGKRLKAIIAPHEINVREIESWRKRLTLPSLTYSEYRALNFSFRDTPVDYLIIDNVGMLSSLYRYGQIAYVGGGFGKGLHNTLEAATFGMPVFFGNKSYHRFSEAVSLLNLGVAKTIESEKELEGNLDSLLSDAEALHALSEKSQHFVASHTGATKTILEVVARLITVK
jgi:3-deoxy-D-manno-octulosonic-acid transferase